MRPEAFHAAAGKADMTANPILDAFMRRLIASLA